MTTVDTKEIYISRIPQELLMTLLTYQSDLSQTGTFQPIRTPSTKRNWRAAMYCTISTRTTETDQRRFAKKAHTKFPTHETRGKSITTAFCTAFGLGHWNCLCPVFFPFTLFLCAWILLCLKRGDGEGRPPSSFFFVVCVLLLYTPNPPRALACTKGNPDEFFVLHLREEGKNRWERDPWVTSSRSIKNFLFWNNIILYSTACFHCVPQILSLLSV